MNYKQVVEYIETSTNFGICPGLDRIKNLLELLDNPEKKLKCIHIAGTNGKGSTTAMLSNILISAGYKTAVYTSPHLYDIRERMTINGAMISEEDFADYAIKVIEKMNQMKDKGMEEPTQFEMLTAIAFLYFSEKKVDMAVIEVGLGGTYDATNVIEPLLAIITSISLDHTDILGDTIELIANEKAGIIKEAATAVLYPQLFQSAENTIEEHSSKVGAKLVKVKKTAAKQKVYNSSGQIFDFENEASTIRDLSLSLIGDHQIINASTALTAINELQKKGYSIEEAAVRKGLSTVVWPCRLSIVSKEPLILIDGAHNADGIDSLKSALCKYFNNKEIIIVIGMLRDKDYRHALEHIIPLAKQVVATEPVSPRALKASEMAELTRKYCPEVYEEQDVLKAIDKAKELYREGSMICICGSLYLAGTAYEYLSK